MSSLVQTTEAVAVCALNSVSIMWVPNHRPPFSWVLPHKLSSCIRSLKSTFLAYFFHSFWKRHFSFSRLNAEPQRSRSCCSWLILSSRGLYPISWAIRKKWASHRNSPFTLTWDATSCDTVLPGEASTRQLPELCPHSAFLFSWPERMWSPGIMLFLPPKRCLRNSKCYQERHDLPDGTLALSTNGKVGTHI